MANQLETARRNFRLTLDRLSQTDFTRHETAIEKNTFLARGRVVIKENNPEYYTDDDLKKCSPR